MNLTKILMMEVEYVQWHVDLREPLAHLLAWVDFIESGTP
jgi:hypothetical protein